MFYMIGKDPNVSLEIDDCSFCTRNIALKDFHHKKRMDVVAYTSVQFKFLEPPAKIFHHSR